MHDAESPTILKKIRKVIYGSYGGSDANESPPIESRISEDVDAWPRKIE